MGRVDMGIPGRVAARWRRAGTVSLAGVLAFAGAGVAAGATPAPAAVHRSIPPGYGQGPGFCGQVVSGGYDLGGGSVSFDDVYPCGPRPGFSFPSYGDLFQPSGGFQCTELANRFLYDAWGLGPVFGSSLDGANYAQTVHADYPQVPLIANGAAGQPYLPGDIVSFTGNSQDPDGHVAVVIASTENSSGNGTVTIMEQNAGSAGKETLTVSGWSLRAASGSWVTPYDFLALHSPQAPSLSVYSANQTYAGDQTNDIALAWTAPRGSGTIASYSVYRDGALIGRVPGNTRTYVDTHLLDGGLLSYQVSATDSAGRVSALSNAITLPYLPYGQSGLAWLGSPASKNIYYCRRGGIGGSFSTQYLICTVFNGTSWKTYTSPGGIDWGYPAGRAWVLFNQHPAFCRRAGMGGSFSTQYLICTVFNGTSWKTYTSPGGIDWGYDTGWGWLSSRLGIAYCRRGGLGGSFSTQYLICTTFNGTSWKTRTSPAGVDWGYDPGAQWVTRNGYPSYCRTTGVPPVSSQALYCTTYNGSAWRTANSGGGIDWGYDTGRGWLSSRLGTAYCRRGGLGGSFSTQYLICTTFNGTSWKTRTSPAGVDWGYDPGAQWVTRNGYPSYCRTTGVPPVSSQALYCTTYNGSAWRTANSGGGIDWGYDTGRAWVTIKGGVAYCRRGGLGGSFSTQYLICTTFNGTSWKTRTSPAGIDWGYDT